MVVSILDNDNAVAAVSRTEIVLIICDCSVCSIVLWREEIVD